MKISVVDTATNLLHIITLLILQQIHYVADVNWHRTLQNIGSRSARQQLISVSTFSDRSTRRSPFL